MKKALLFYALLMILLTKHLPASGQNSFAPVGAEWWHYMSAYFYSDGSENHSTFHTR